MCAATVGEKRRLGSEVDGVQRTGAPCSIPRRPVQHSSRWFLCGRKEGKEQWRRVDATEEDEIERDKVCVVGSGPRDPIQL